MKIQKGDLVRYISFYSEGADLRLVTSLKTGSPKHVILDYLGLNEELKDMMGFVDSYSLVSDIFRGEV